MKILLLIKHSIPWKISTFIKQSTRLTFDANKFPILGYDELFTTTAFCVFFFFFFFFCIRTKQTVAAYSELAVCVKHCIGQVDNATEQKKTTFRF